MAAIEPAVAQIVAAINSVSYPIPAGYIVKLSGLEKSLVNRILYAGKGFQFEQLESIPPLWRNITVVKTVND